MLSHEDARLRALEAELAALRSSISWRMTAPLRAAGRLADAVRWHRRAKPVVSGLPAQTVTDVLFGADTPLELHAEVARLVATAPVRDASGLRRVLSAIHGHQFPARARIAFGPADIVEREVGGMRMMLDTHDCAVSQTIIGGYDYEPHLTAVFERLVRPGMTVVDAGANVGYYTLLASRLVGTKGRVVAVEPDSDNCRLILLSLALNAVVNVELLAVALDSTRGWAYFSRGTGSNAGLLGDDRRGDMAAWPGAVVPAFPLDDLVDGPIHFLKMDLEGGEGRAIVGARRTIERWRPIVTSELSASMLAATSGVAVRDYLGWFAGRGYRLSFIERLSREPVPIEDPDAFAASWGPADRIEDLLLTPAESTQPC